MQTTACAISKKSYTYPDWRFFRLYIIVPILAAFFCLALSAPVHAKQTQISDIDINRVLESEFWSDVAVDANLIDIKTQKGVITLTGTMSNLLAKERAERIAETIVGVRAVVNRIKVKPGVSRSDAELAQTVNDALLLDPAADSYKITPKAENGVVTLTGTVDSWQEGWLCVTAAKGVKGVTEIKNNITVKYKTDRPDLEIKKEIEALLENDVRVDDYLIKVEVKNSKVILSGTVGSLAEKSRANNDAYVGGVSSVDSVALKIEWWARDKMRRKSAYVTRSDDQIKKAVKDAFRYDPRVFSFNPDVDVDNGRVTLSSVVDNLKAKEAAEQDARNVIGVWRVKNHLKVRPVNIPSDDVLEKRVATALFVNSWVDRFEIDIDAVAGWVYLSGDVTIWFEKNIAERVAEGVKGVTNVINNITYPDSWTWKPDQEIREDVKDELFWSLYVDADQVSITVFNGVVTLAGNVETLSERKAAEDNAYEGGARNVINNLTVTYRYYGPHYDRSYYYPYY
ncbi:MAG: BON domain-containing protein [Desulfobulbaceae bacterium]|nr:BON domain-containing protein [Desulfobulbaceae bacterium]